MEKFLRMYRNLHADNLEILKTVYRQDIHFTDPAHQISGIDNLTAYFAALYANIDSIHFSFLEPLMVDNKGYVRWEMTFSHRRLDGGRPITVVGASYLEFDQQGKVYFHQDYFDLGAMLYEHVPLLGRFVRSIKKGLGK
ncbi:nuclear transport factor 2 family protein [Desulfogranum marinum]|uniref:nuclear transport factor 2 family protein n=1 Tax=Desulfogranum marinum TaxID=453220 RepID=UPI00196569A3|nr:nuclear transport factor 2 family protein [Desulfogranum marinum]MBM9513930.1 nuclear transport factor 2 family protein [Desulfogranum marinum]